MKLFVDFSNSDSVNLEIHVVIDIFRKFVKLLPVMWNTAPFVILKNADISENTEGANLVAIVCTSM